MLTFQALVLFTNFLQLRLLIKILTCCRGTWFLLDSCLRCRPDEQDTQGEVCGAVQYAYSWRCKYVNSENFLSRQTYFRISPIFTVVSLSQAALMSYSIHGILFSVAWKLPGIISSIDISPSTKKRWFWFAGSSRVTLLL